MSRSRPGRLKIDAEIRQLIRRMSQDNPTWGAPGILSELLLLGHQVAESTIARYMVRPRKPPSPTWRSFLKNHAGHIAAVDFFIVATVTFRVLYCFIVLRHDRRQVVHVAANPTAQWTARQVRQAFPYDEAPRYMIRDRDSIYGEVFRQSVEKMHVQEVLIAPRSPWQNPYAECVIGSIRRECLDHVIVLNEGHLRRILAEYVEYYNNVRPHLSLHPQVHRATKEWHSRCRSLPRWPASPLHACCLTQSKPIPGRAPSVCAYGRMGMIRTFHKAPFQLN